MIAATASCSSERPVRAAKQAALLAIRRLAIQEEKDDLDDHLMDLALRTYEMELECQARRLQSTINYHARIERRAKEKRQERILKLQRDLTAEELRQERITNHCTLMKYCMTNEYRYSEELLDQYLAWKRTYPTPLDNRYEKYVAFMAERETLHPPFGIFVKTMTGELLSMEYNPNRIMAQLIDRLHQWDRDAYPKNGFTVFRITEEGPVTEGEIFGLLRFPEIRVRHSIPVFLKRQLGYECKITMFARFSEPYDVSFYVRFYHDGTVEFRHDGRRLTIEEFVNRLAYNLVFTHYYIGITGPKNRYTHYVDNQDDKDDLAAYLRHVSTMYMK